MLAGLARRADELGCWQPAAWGEWEVPGSPRWSCEGRSSALCSLGWRNPTF